MTAVSRDDISLMVFVSSMIWSLNQLMYLNNFGSCIVYIVCSKLCVTNSIVYL